MAARIVLFGATGHTGRLTAARLTAGGARPVLAGRDSERLADLAGRLGGLEHAFADAARPESVRALVERGDVLVSTVGPFARWGTAAVTAAVHAGARYLDSSGEPGFIRSVFETHGPPARKTGAALVPAMGYDYVPGSLAGALALERAAGAAERVDVGYFVTGRSAGASRGTRMSAVGVALNPSLAFRDGVLRTVRPGERRRSFRVGSRTLSALSVGGAEHFALPAAYPRLREVNVFLGWFGTLTPVLRGASLLLAGLTRAPRAREALRAAGERFAGRSTRPPADERLGNSLVVATAHDRRGELLSAVELRGPEPYELTARLLAWAAERAAAGALRESGAMGPLEAFGLTGLRSGCQGAGLSMVEGGVEGER